MEGCRNGTMLWALQPKVVLHDPELRSRRLGGAGQQVRTVVAANSRLLDAAKIEDESYAKQS